MQTPLIIYVLVVLGLLLYIIPIWYIIKKILNKYTEVNIQLVEIKMAMGISTFVISYTCFYFTLKLLNFIFATIIK